MRVVVHTQQLGAERKQTRNLRHGFGRCSNAQPPLFTSSMVCAGSQVAAYDGVRCPLQKCLIHLLRDINDEALKYPYDEELKRLAQAFGGLVRPMVETVDRFGLKSHYLRKHRVAVDRFYRQLATPPLQSRAAIKLKDRFQKNQDKLFTFLSFDGVPWNNNNAEHAVKAFATLRKSIGGNSTAKGIREYLVLLSICETCKYKKLDFLEFLRSDEKSIEAFASSLRRQ
ncbi:MAG: transposase [Burkholderiales bacterium]